MESDDRWITHRVVAECAYELVVLGPNMCAHVEARGLVHVDCDAELVCQAATADERVLLHCLGLNVDRSIVEWDLIMLRQGRFTHLSPRASRWRHVSIVKIMTCPGMHTANSVLLLGLNDMPWRMGNRSLDVAMTRRCVTSHTERMKSGRSVIAARNFPSSLIATCLYRIQFRVGPGQWT